MSKSCDGITHWDISIHIISFHKIFFGGGVIMEVVNLTIAINDPSLSKTKQNNKPLIIPN